MLVLPPKRETESGKGWDQERGEALKHPSTLNEHDSGGPLCEIQRVSQKKKSLKTTQGIGRLFVSNLLCSLRWVTSSL